MKCNIVSIGEWSNSLEEYDNEQGEPSTSISTRFVRPLSMDATGAGQSHRARGRGQATGTRARAEQ